MSGTITRFGFVMNSFHNEEAFRKQLEDFIFAKLGEEIEVEVDHDSKD